MKAHLNPNPLNIGYPAHFFVPHYLLYDGERKIYSLETEILPCEPDEDVKHQRWIIMHKIDLEVSCGVYELDKFLYVLSLYPVYRHLSTEAYERWLGLHPERIPPLPEPFWSETSEV